MIDYSKIWRCISLRNALISSLPHTRGLYGQDTATKNAKTIRAMRARRKELKNE